MIFVILYFALLLLLSCGAAYYNQRSAFLLLFSLTLVSLVLAIIGGIPALRFVAIAAGMLLAAGMMSYAFREFLTALASDEMAKELRTAPLTAAFGMFVIFVVAIMGIFAPAIAPYGEAEIVSQAFAPPDNNMLLGADQLGRDMFSRIIYGARNTVALALCGTVLAFILGAMAGLLAATKGGFFDGTMGRIADVIMSIPSLIFALLMLSIFGGSLASPQTSSWLLFGFGAIVGLLFLMAAADSLIGWLIGAAIVAVAAFAFALAGTTIFNASEVILILVVAVSSPRVFRLTRASRARGGDGVSRLNCAARELGRRRRSCPTRRALVVEFGLEFCFVFLLIAGPLPWLASRRRRTGGRWCARTRR
ncbi:MAG: ABC transporter permease [Roseovarius sp.]